eukprot:c26781_g1_i1 orf=55-333(+)
MRTVLVWDFRHVEMLDIYMQIHLLLDNRIYHLDQQANGAIAGLLLTMEAHSLVGPVNAPDILKAVRDSILNVKLVEAKQDGVQAWVNILKGL